MDVCPLNAPELKGIPTSIAVRVCVMRCVSVLGDSSAPLFSDNPIRQLSIIYESN